MYNGYVSGLTALYLGIVLWNGNGGDLVDELKKESGFVKWGAALLILGIIHSTMGGKAGDIVKQVIVAAIAGLLLSKGEKVIEQLGKFFKDIK